jgi:predicted nucleic acid-binding protein
LSVYADSSLVVSLYVTETYSREAQRRMAHRPRIWLTPLHRVEWAHAIAQHVFRGTLSSQEAAGFYTVFEADRASDLWLESAIPDTAYETAVQLAKRHGPRLGVRTLDTLHVACALELGAKEFWTFDQRQERLAKAAGLAIS